MARAQSKLDFRDVILSVANCSANVTDAEIDSLREQFREVFLRFGSQTDDNMSCVKQIEVGRIDDGTAAQRPTVGLRFANGNWALSTVLNSAEGCSLPAQLSADCPALTQPQWDAAFCMVTMMILALEGEPVIEAE